ncbi:hypothetical protein NDU88_001581 [Pleurodeles waltl]|uniref:Uncharacterized protein n=1 Tax=Pleurodeles waltl TaxID=8319 RepID=A0AAV7P964_PLEWA|nr:hypothetical protein NDU88_001581 [Pleurodeles waltl]
MNTKPHMTAKLRMVMRNLHFVDVWREMYPTSRIFSCYTPTHGAYSRLDRFLLANDGLLDVRCVVYQVWFLSDHAPLLLECETHIPKPAIPLWRLRPDLLGDPEYKQDLRVVLNGYFSTNWGTARGIQWEALKVVIRGESLSKTYGIRKRLDQKLRQQEDVLAALQRQIDNCDASESDCLELRVNLHLREHLRAIYATPCGVGVTRIQEYLDGLRLPRFMEAQSEELKGEVSLDDLVFFVVLPGPRLLFFWLFCVFCLWLHTADMGKHPGKYRHLSLALPPKGVATLDIVLWARLHLAPVVHYIVLHWTPASGNFEALIPVSTPIHQDLLWWLHPPSLDRGFPLQSLTPVVLTTNASSLS